MAIKYEEALERLETIVKRLESSELPLEESFDLFEEGVKLTKLCKKKIDSMELKIKKVTGDGLEVNMKAENLIMQEEKENGL